MTIVDISKIKPGDKVGLEVVVLRLEGDSIVASVANKLRANNIISHTPAPREIKVGDKVTWGTGEHGYEVFGIHNGVAWLPDGFCSPETKFLAHLRHYEEPTP